MAGDLEKREKEYLIRIVEEYIRTGEPVSSRQVSNIYGVDLSSASIRNIMLALTERNFLEQPHTSSGRVPSDKAYRVYVDDQFSRTGGKEKEEWKDRFFSEKETLNATNVLKENLKMLSDATHCASLASEPDARFQVLKSVEFFQLSEKQVLVVVITEAGIVKSHQVSWLSPFDQLALENLGKNLTDFLRGKTVQDFQTGFLKILADEKMAKEGEQFTQAVHMGKKALALENETTLIFQGRNYMLAWPELKKQSNITAIYQEMESGSELFQALQQEEDLNRAYCKIGQEINLENFSNCSLVAANYGSQKAKLGTIGILGPKRMNYFRMANLVETVSKIVSSYFR